MKLSVNWTHCSLNHFEVQRILLRISFSMVSPVETLKAQVEGLHIPEIAWGAPSDDVGDPKIFVKDPAADPEAWNAQLFRQPSPRSVIKYTHFVLGLPQGVCNAQRVMWHLSSFGSVPGG